MKSILCTLLSSFAAGAAIYPQPFHPYRQLDGAGTMQFKAATFTNSVTYANLSTLYAWLSNPSGPQPMPDWQIFRDTAVDEYIVFQVLPESVLIVHQAHHWNAYVQSMQTSSDVFILKHYPSANLVDNDHISFIARRAGRHQYQDRDGVLHTVPVFDYGIPYDPFQLARDKAATNSLSLTNVAIVTIYHSVLEEEPSPLKSQISDFKFPGLTNFQAGAK